MKTLLALVLSVSFLFSFSGVKASSTEISNQNEYITEEECMLAGNKWIRANYSNRTCISDIIQVRNIDGTLSGYCINFELNGEPAGYLLLNAEKYCDEYIREFSFDGEGIYECLVQNAKSCAAKTVSRETEVIYVTNPYEYAIKVNVGADVLFYNSNNSFLPTELEMQE